MQRARRPTQGGPVASHRVVASAVQERRMRAKPKNNDDNDTLATVASCAQQ